jgi:hypothetical protein
LNIAATPALTLDDTFASVSSHARAEGTPCVRTRARVNDFQAIGANLLGMEQKVTPELAQHLAKAHADGVNYRTLGKLYDIAPSLAHRHVKRVNAAAPGPEHAPTPPDVEPESGTDVHEPQPFPEPPSPARPNREPDTPGPEPVEVAPPSGATKRHPESAFPEYVLPDVQMQPGDMVVLEPVIRERPPERAPGQHAKSNMHPLDWAEHNLKTDLPDKLVIYEARRDELRTFIDTWADAYAGLSFGRPPISETGVQVTSQQLRDGPRPALWDNPHDHGPGGRGFELVGGWPKL